MRGCLFIFKTQIKGLSVFALRAQSINKIETPFLNLARAQRENWCQCACQEKQIEWGIASSGRQFLHSSPKTRQISFSTLCETDFSRGVWHSSARVGNREQRAFCSLSSPHVWCYPETRTQPATGAFCIRNGSNCLFSLSLKVCTGFQVQTRKAASTSHRALRKAEALL